MFSRGNSIGYSRLNSQSSAASISYGWSSGISGDIFLSSDRSSVPYSRLSSVGSSSTNPRSSTSLGSISDSPLLQRQAPQSISNVQGNSNLVRSSNITGLSRDRVPGIGVQGQFRTLSDLPQGGVKSSSVSSTPLQNGVRQLWDVQEAKIASNAKNMLASTAETASAKTIRGFSGTLGLGAYVSQQAGQGINSLLTNAETATQRSDYDKNIANLTLGGSQSANIIRNEQQKSIDSRNTAGAIGSLFGPVGALVGHALGGKSFDSSVLNTFNSVTGGKVNPTDTGIAGSLNASASSGTTNISQNVN
ncbi:putative capsid protein [Solenopsis invicta virus 8]|nr:putative capsid protein [Solenopsis invicta virus 8]